MTPLILHPAAKQEVEVFIAGNDLHTIAAPSDGEADVANGQHCGYTAITTEPMPGIEKTPGVNGGDACIAGTRIPVWGLEEMRRGGATENELLEDFPSLTRERLRQAWAYVKANPDEIEAALSSHAGA
jgi:uncharacterized protein (DUF433 family)